MNLTPEQLKAIEDLAYRLIAPDMVAINIGVDEIDFIHAIRTAGTEARNEIGRAHV